MTESTHFTVNHRQKGLPQQKKKSRQCCANTTKEQRIALIRQWIPDEDGLGDSGDMDLWDIYADYINGKKEIAEINAEMSGTYYTEEDLQ